jgi:DNA modification methylase
MNVAIIPITTITVGKRFRENYGDVEQLAESIRSKGLITPLAVSSYLNGEGTRVFNLLAGGRRYQACKLAGLTELPVRIYDRELTELELRSIELEENIQRKDLEWIEQVNLQREIHRLQIEIHGQKLSTSPDATGWSMRDTAKLLNKSIGGISMDVKLADAVEQMPDLEWDQCKSKHDAMKLLARAEETIIRAELARRVMTLNNSSSAEGMSVNGLDSRRKKLIDSYFVNDFLEGIKKLDDGLFNLVEIDPPYGIELGKMKKKDGISRYAYSVEGYNEADADGYVDFLHEVLTACYRVMADHSWLLLWFAPEPWFEKVYGALLDCGFTTSRMCGLWIKPTSQTMNPNFRLANAYEMFFYACKGQPTLAKPGASNVFSYSQVAAQLKVHPTERPLGLMEELLGTFGYPSSRVLVPFAGSGVSLLAAAKLGMLPLGYDLSQQYKDAFTLRVSQSDV